MMMLKCFCSSSGNYSKLIPHTFRNKNHLRTYTLLTAERKKFRKLRSSLSFQSYTTSVTHLSALKSKDKLKDNPTIQLQPLKFQDLSFDEPVSHDDLINVLYKCKTMSEQMEMLASTLCLSSNDIKNRIQFCKTIESFFKPIFSDFKVQIFGSTVNGLGFKGCDIDLSFETSNKARVELSDKEKNAIDEPNIPLVSEVLCGKVTPQEICAMASKDKLCFIHHVMLEYYKDSVESVPIFINAHVPLIRFHHEKFGLKCDLTYKNKVAFANTKLLYLFNKIDKRVAPFLMTTRYWAKHHELIGKGLLFNSYTISLMVIFFLQTRNPPVLPSVESILDLFDGFKDHDMSDDSFMSVLEKIPPSKNEQSLEELLKEFFFFYSYFDFTQVIRPLSATAIPIEDFRTREESLNFKHNTFCVQDPMCLPHNVAELVKYENCVRFVHEMVIACNIFQKDISKPSTNPWGLVSLLNTPKKSYNSLITSKVVSLSIPLLPKSMIGEVPHNEKTSISADTLMKTFNALLLAYKPLKTNEYLNLLQKQDDLVLKYKMTAEARARKRSVNQQSWKGLNKMEPEVMNEATTHNLEVEETMQQQFQNLSVENHLIFCAECTASKNVWDNRSLIELNAVHDLESILEKEHFVSSLTAKANAKKKATEPYSFLCECFVSKENPETLILNFRPYKKPHFKLIVSTFLKEYIPKIMRNISERN